jgi:hypothetical protein
VVSHLLAHGANSLAVGAHGDASEVHHTLTLLRTGQTELNPEPPL